MIESYYWKQDLFKLLEKIEDFETFFDDEIFIEKLCTLEKDIIIGFMIIRRLMESKTKLSNRVYEKKIKLVRFPIKDKARLDIIHVVDIEKNYYMDKPEEVMKKINFICNQLLHHAVIFLLTNEKGKIESLIFTSDFEKNKWLYEIDKESIQVILEIVGNDKVNQIKYNYNIETGQYDVKTLFEESNIDFDDINTKRKIERNINGKL